MVWIWACAKVSAMCCDGSSECMCALTNSCALVVNGSVNRRGILNMGHHKINTSTMHIDRQESQRTSGLQGVFPICCSVFELIRQKVTAKSIPQNKNLCKAGSWISWLWLAPWNTHSWVDRGARWIWMSETTLDHGVWNRSMHLMYLMYLMFIVALLLHLCHLWYRENYAGWFRREWCVNGVMPLTYCESIYLSEENPGTLLMTAQCCLLATSPDKQSLRGLGC